MIVDQGSAGEVVRSLSTLFRAGTAAGLSDRALLERFADREGSDDPSAELAFAVIVERHGPMVLRVCRSALGDRDEADDAFQATFLVLASRARSIRRADSVGSWLHGVALRVCSRLRRREARRRRHESRRVELHPVHGTVPKEGWTGDEVDRVLHEEVGRLPEKYRRAVVLCYLEGLTHDQAADRLGWPVGTVRSRLARARDRLRERLIGRGVAPGMATAWETTRGTIAVPPGLAGATVRGALRIGSGKAAMAGVVPAGVFSLMKEVTRTMTITGRIAMTAAVMTAGLVVTGVGLLAQPGQGPGAGGEVKVRLPEPAKKPGPAAAGSLDDQVDAMLREYDEAAEILRKTAATARKANRLIKKAGEPTRFDAQAEARLQAQQARVRPIPRQMLNLAEQHPRTNAAERALIWVAAQNSISPEVTRAYEILARDHARSDRIKQVFSRRMAQVHWCTRSAEDLLQSVLEQNPYREIRGHACYWLAEMLAFRALVLRTRPVETPSTYAMWLQRLGAENADQFLKQDPGAVQHRAARLYDRLIEEFDGIVPDDFRLERPPMLLGRAAVSLSDVARVRLDAIHRLSPGKPAPEIEGSDLDGQPMKLSDSRGKVVVLFVAGFGLPAAFPPERAPSHIVGVLGQVARAFQGKPVELRGVVDSHREGYQQAIQESGLPIRMWWDSPREGQPEPAGGRIWGPRPGPILTAWDAESSNWYVIDAKGVIRYSRVYGPEMIRKAVEAVLKE